MRRAGRAKDVTVGRNVREGAEKRGGSANHRQEVERRAEGGGRRAVGAPLPSAYRRTRLLYEKALASVADVRDVRLEGDAAIAFPDGRLRLTNRRDPAEGQSANFVLWCPEDFPADIEVSWEFWPLREPGLCMLFFAATGRQGETLFDPRLARRTGEYPQYHSGDLDALHVSYFRRRAPEERAFHTCNLRKSYGFHLVCQGADPLPPVADARPPYRLTLTKDGPRVAFAINELPIFRWTDDGRTYGPVLAGGKIGFRQMAPLVAEYANLRVHALEVREGE